MKEVTANTLIIGIKNDLLFPVEEQKLLANSITNAQYFEIDSFYGHDGFLIETKTIDQAIKNFLIKKTSQKTQEKQSIFKL